MIRKEFRVHMLNEEGKTKAAQIAHTFAACLDKIEKLCPEGREMAIVRTKMEEASFFAKKAMAQHAENQEPPRDPKFHCNHTYTDYNQGKEVCITCGLDPNCTPPAA